MFTKFMPVLLLLTTLFSLSMRSPIPAADTTYYVSSSMGDDSNDGLSEDAPFATIAHVNSLSLEPGDSVLFKCGDTWRTESLVITESGIDGNPITFGSYPADCADKPIISGAQPISDWVLDNGSIYRTDLSAGANADKFPVGINQLFQDDARLPFGRWPNIDANNDGGYTTIDAEAGDTITDNELPANDWSGARAHIKGMRWYILNRRVVSSNGTNLTFSFTPDCWGGCVEWGYFLNNHLSTLDQEGEWYYDETANQVYLYSSSGVPTNIEGSVVIDGADEGFHGGIILGQHLYAAIHYVIIENLTVTRWFDNGITTPRNLETEDNSHLTIRKVEISDIDNAAIFFATWIWNAGDNSGWRGGRNLLVENNLIERANHTAINSYTTDSIYQDNVIRDIALIENLGRDGMGCEINQGGGFCTRDGMALRFPVDNPTFSGFGNTIQYNRLERTGHSGIQMFGSNATIAYNVIQEAGYAKGDTGGILVYGNNGFANTYAHDITIQHNIIISATGNTDGAAMAFEPIFAAGIYIDNYADNVTVANNTVIGSAIDGILFQNARGSLTGNTLYNNNAGTMSRGQIGLYQSTTEISSMSNNVLYGLNRIDAFTFAKTLHTESADASNILNADNNYYFNPYRSDHISIGFNLQTLAEWQVATGMDANATTNWFSLNPEDAPLSRIFYNDTKSDKAVNLGNNQYLDLDQNDVTSLTLAPFTSKVLIWNGEGGGGTLTPTLTISPTRLQFEGDTSPAQQVTVSNMTTTSIEISDIAISPGFTQTNACPATLNPADSCTIQVTFTATDPGPIYGSLTITPAVGEVYTVALAGGGRRIYLPVVLK